MRARASVLGVTRPRALRAPNHALTKADADAVDVNGGGDGGGNGGAGICVSARVSATVASHGIM